MGLAVRAEPFGDLVIRARISLQLSGRAAVCPAQLVLGGQLGEDGLGTVPIGTTDDHVGGGHVLGAAARMYRYLGAGPTGTDDHGVQSGMPVLSAGAPREDLACRPCSSTQPVWLRAAHRRLARGSRRFG